VSTDAESVGADPRYYVEGVARAAHVLKLIAAHNGPASVAGLAKQLGWTKAAVYRIVRTLDALGFLRSTDRGYVPGPALITLGQSALEATGLLPVARPHLEALSDALGETVVLTVLDGRDIVYVDCIEVEAILMTRSTVGSHLPAYCTCSGQVQLAGLANAEVSKRLGKVTMTDRGPNTLTSLPELIRRLETIRNDGYAVNDQELAVGHRSLAVPVFSHDGAVAAALSVSVPAARVPLDDLKGFLPTLLTAADKISRDLGAPADSSLNEAQARCD
jgi:IclR family pca regulon transcriptional regulator